MLLKLCSIAVGSGGSAEQAGGEHRAARGRDQGVPWDDQHAAGARQEQASPAMANGGGGCLLVRFERASMDSATHTTHTPPGSTRCTASTLVFFRTDPINNNDHGGVRCRADSEENKQLKEGKTEGSSHWSTGMAQRRQGGRGGDADPAMASA